MKKRDVLIYLAAFAVAYILYQLVAVHLQQLWLLIVYAVLLILSLGGFVIYGNGFPLKEVDREKLPHGWTENQKKDFLDECRRRRRIRIPLLITALAIGTVFLFDTVFLYFGETLQRFDLFGGMKW